MKPISKFINIQEKKMKQAKLTSIMIFIACLSGCSKEVPSDEDAKKAILNMIGGCEYLSIKNFKKTNGIQKDDNNYIVSIEYEIHAKPIPETKKIIDAYSAKLADINERLQIAQSQMAAAAQETKILFDKNESTGERWTQATENHANSIKLKDSIENEKTQFLANAVNPLAKFSEKCPSTNRELYAYLYSGDDLSKYATDFTKQFSGNLSMVKTENGWIPAN